MPLIEYECQSCGDRKEHIMQHPVADEVQCKECGNMCKRQFSTFGSYSIKGNNSASITPKKYRKN